MHPLASVEDVSERLRAVSKPTRAAAGRSPPPHPPRRSPRAARRPAASPLPHAGRNGAGPSGTAGQAQPRRRGVPSRERLNFLTQPISGVKKRHFFLKADVFDSVATSAAKPFSGRSVGSVINTQDVLGTTDRTGLVGKSVMLRKNSQAFGHQPFFMSETKAVDVKAGIKELTATKICVTSKGIVEHFQCIRCNYTEKFQRQTAWQFHYIGFPVELETKYFIHAYNLPSANIKEDFLSKSFLLTTPGCKDNVMKYSKSCIEMGCVVLITSTVIAEIHFITYMFITNFKLKSFQPSGSLWNPNITVCQTETELEVNFTTSSLGLEYLILLYEHEKYEVLLEKNVEAKVQLQLHVKVLVIYPEEVYFHHTVLSFAELLHEGCQTDVILDMWEKRRIAEKGPVQWLAAQKAAADRVIFLSSNPTTAACNVSCKSMRNHNNMENMFTLAVNLFCSDMTNQSYIQKYTVVSFNEVSSQNTLPSALKFCPKYCLMKDTENFCRDLSVSCNEVHGKK
ncbi:interleukin-17 receptor B [Gavia stellata]|uniref:interleukin-17 receptor B n=1 Tax=Gavia stellata TaxID=37040 RepID=UPI00289DD3C3|nr:interleukin-17 receptor B [Gavia stellata]